MSERPYEPIECETLEYTNPDGDSIRVRMLVGVAGRMMAPANLTTVAIPQSDGSAFLGADYLARAVTVPVPFPGSLLDRDELRRWAKVLDPKRGEGVLAVVQGEWAGRQLVCTYEAGLDELEEQGDVQTGTLLFRAAWPYWQDPDDSEIDVAQGGALVKWFPFLPLVLGASDAFAGFTIDNDGDATAWPVVVVNGPGLEVEARNETTGERWHVNGALLGGQTMTVDTRPGHKTVDIAGANGFPRLASGSNLWGLAPGPNRVTVSMAATDPTSLIRFTWRRNWLAA
jgi:hypothetical protein